MSQINTSRKKITAQRFPSEQNLVLSEVHSSKNVKEHSIQEKKQSKNDQHRERSGSRLQEAIKHLVDDIFFNSIDADEDGFLSKEEVTNAMMKYI